MPGVVTILRWRVRHLLQMVSRVLPSGNVPQKVQRILCIIPGGLGDRLMALPALRQWHVRFPSARITVIWLHGSLEPVDKEFSAVIAHGQLHWFASMLRALARWDVVFVSSQGVFSIFSEALALLTRAPVRIGPTSGNRPASHRIYTQQYPLTSKTHATVVNFRGVDICEESAPIPYRVAYTPRSHDPGKSHFRKIIAIHVGSKKGYEIKRWPIRKWADLIIRIKQDSVLDCMILAGPDDSYDATAIADLIPVRIVRTPSLTDLFDNIYLCDCLVANDSGPAHVAAALDVPAIVLFGPTDPARVGPVMHRGGIVGSACEFGPCFDTTGTCTQQISCMEKISVEVVFSVVNRVLGSHC